MHTLALALVVAGLLLAASVLASRLSGWLGVPIALLFLGVGMAAGSEGPGGIAFSDFSLASNLGTVALVLILYDGGLNTHASAFRNAVRPAGVLATVGVLGTAGALAVVARLLGFSWPHALVLGAIVSSTDAAAVFAVLRGSGLQLRRRLADTLELESGLNDPLAVVLTVTLTEALLDPGSLSPLSFVLGTLWQLAVGAAVGVGLGMAWAWVLRRVRLPAAGLYPVLSLALALLAFGLATLLQGSGFLAVYAAGAWVGNRTVRYRTGLVRVHDALAWLSQVGMFLVLGLLVFPHRLAEVAVPGLLLGLALAFVCRPLVVALLLLPFRFRPAEALYLCWVGLRGAVPIVLATVPVLAGVPGSDGIFHLVFFIVVVNTLLPGATVPWVTRKLKVAANAPPPPAAVLEVASTALVEESLHSFFIAEASAAAHARISDLPFPPESAAALIVRGTRLIAPKGDTELLPGDHVYVFCRYEDLEFLRLVLGQQEEE